MNNYKILSFILTLIIACYLGKIIIYNKIEEHNIVFDEMYSNIELEVELSNKLIKSKKVKYFNTGVLHVFKTVKDIGKASFNGMTLIEKINE